MPDMYAAVDLGGTNIKAALADAEGNLVAEGKVPTESQEGPAAVLERIADLVQQLIDESGRRPTALGMGVPGLVDVENGITRFLPNMPTKWRDVPAGETLVQRLGCDVRLLNDVRMATLGELIYGRGRPADTMVFFALGTGVGGGIVIENKLRLGPLGAAGEVGHQTIMPDGPLCGCGNRGCLETLVSGPAISAEGIRLMETGLAPLLHEIVGGDPGKVTPREMKMAADRGEAPIADAIQRAGDYLGTGVANVVLTLHPDLVVLGGGVSNLGDLLLEPVRAALKQKVRLIPPESVQIELSALGDKAGIMGGIALASRGVSRTG